jgi:hypothetical protein
MPISVLPITRSGSQPHEFEAADGLVQGKKISRNLRSLKIAAKKSNQSGSTTPLLQISS